jgi:hypothetical protein
MFASTGWLLGKSSTATAPMFARFFANGMKHTKSVWRRWLALTGIPLDEQTHFRLPGSLRDIATIGGQVFEDRIRAFLQTLQ